MSTPTCPKCKRAIPGEEVNVAKDVAYCRACNVSYSLSELTHGEALDESVDLRNPPPGAWYQSNMAETVIGATHRSWGTAIGALLFGLFWNGIVSIFVLLALAGTLRHLNITLPEWFPAPNMNGGPMSVGMTIFLWLFLTPFIAIGVGMILAFLSALGGRTEVRLANGQAVVFTGIGAIGFRRRFATSDVKEVRIDDRQWRDSDGDRRRKCYLLVETREGKRIKFASSLTEERRNFMAAALRRVLPAA